MIRIRFANERDREGLLALFDAVAQRTMRLEGLVGDELDEAIREEDSYNRDVLKEAFYGEDSVRDYIVATIDDRIVGSICYGPCSEYLEFFTIYPHINEIGPAYVLPKYKSKGIGDILLNHMVMHLRTKGVKEVSFDSGNFIVKKRWVRRFGEPTISVKNFWGDTKDHYIWYRDPNDMPVEYVIGV